MALLYLKALHLIFAVTWFAALFYLPRIFIYQTEASQLPNPDKDILVNKYKDDSKRLWFFIGWPSLVLTLIFGLGILHPYFGIWPLWLVVKLGLIAGLIAYHHFVHFTYKALQKDVYKYSGIQLRYINEIATIFLFGIIFLGILKSATNFLHWGIILFALVLFLLWGIQAYKKRRERQS
jgi:putative membrane protein